jgi:hypothetical protein
MWKPVLFVALVTSVPSQAQPQTGGAICREGQGCVCLSLDTGLLPVIMGADGIGDTTLPDTIIVDRTNNATIRTGRSIHEVHRAYGGQGECPADEPPGPIMPLDGTWQWRTLSETTSGCPPMMAGAIAASRTETLSTSVVWEGGFDPRRLAASLPAPEMSGMSAYEWRELGPNRWLSDNIRGRECEDGTCVSVALALSMTLVAPTRISGVLTMRSQVEGAQAAILAGFGMADCRIRMRYQIDRIAP